MRIWLDDLRPAPEGWTWAKTVPEAQRLLQQEKADALSLDHDLGEDEQTGYDLVMWLCWQREADGNDYWPKTAPVVHS